ncbi:MAG TPA: hypothetical protein PLT28_00200 [Saprospiraceae bacterium]|nr:hypothetical protein [Saprospiraceae bacterium]
MNEGNNMKFLFWKIFRDEYAIAHVEWLLYKWFGIKRTIPCGRNKKDAYLCCCLTPSLANSIIVNDGNKHEIQCKVCGSTHISANYYIKNIDDEIW